MKTSLTVLFIIFTSFLNAQNDSIKINTKNIIYKNINGYDLNMKVISSKDNKNSKAAIVFFFWRRLENGIYFSI